MGAGFYEINAKPASTKVGVKVEAELGNTVKLLHFHTKDVQFFLDTQTKSWKSYNAYNFCKFHLIPIICILYT